MHIYIYIYREREREREREIHSCQKEDNCWQTNGKEIKKMRKRQKDNCFLLFHLKNLIIVDKWLNCVHYIFGSVKVGVLSKKLLVIVLGSNIFLHVQVHI